jgi:phage baseplate assembly protein W
MAVPHFAIPFQVVNGSAATVEQDSLDDIAQCVQVLVTTTVGERVEAPFYGVPNPMFSEINDGAPGTWLAAIRKWEPRASAVISDQVSSTDELMRQLSVNVTKANVGH